MIPKYRNELILNKLLTCFYVIFFFITNGIEFGSYPDGNTPLFVGKDIVDAISKLKNTTTTLFECFKVVNEGATWTT